MQAFISWSGNRSRVIGEALRDWLPLVVHGLSCWMSSEDVHAGERWGISVSNELMKSEYGILVLTRDNMNAPWILFEAGALAKAVGLTQVCPILINVTPQEIPQPLGQFQSVRLDQDGMWRLVRSLYSANPATFLSDSQQLHIMQGLWPSFAEALNDSPSRSVPVETGHDPRITVVEFSSGVEVRHHLSFPRTLQELLDLLYREILGDEVPVFSYGSTWALRNLRNDKELAKEGDLDHRSLEELDLHDGDTLAVVRLGSSDSQISEVAYDENIEGVSRQ